MFNPNDLWILELSLEGFEHTELEGNLPFCLDFLLHWYVNQNKPFFTIAKQLAHIESESLKNGQFLGRQWTLYREPDPAPAEEDEFEYNEDEWSEPDT